MHAGMHARSAQSQGAIPDDAMPVLCKRDFRQLGWTPLHAACDSDVGPALMWRGQIDVARLLVQSGANVNAAITKVSRVDGWAGSSAASRPTPRAAWVSSAGSW
jgi:hypothetical protein